MKGLKLWQKAGLTLLVALPLTLGIGFTPKQTSKGLESKIPSISMSTAEAKETNSQGYEVPDLAGYSFVREVDLDMSNKVPGKETKAELWQNQDGDNILKLKFKGEVYGYSYVSKDEKKGYGLIASKQKGVYDQKYGLTEDMEIPDRLV